MSSSSYDDVPYSSYPFVRAAPDRLCTLARIFGVAAALPSEARVLELGCASGGNLVPLADRMPRARFVGVDLSARQIAEGRELVAEAGLENVDLRHASILEVDASWGEFDYVICHGVYSWVPPEVQRHILEVCRTSLRPNGIAYVSYNTYPGWHLRESVRHMMRYHVRSIPEPSRQVAQARALVEFLAGAVANQPGPYAALLKQELAQLSDSRDEYLFHEHLEELNQPLYFHEFAERIQRHELQYLCDSELHTMLTREFAPPVRETLDKIGDLEQLEQYGDFVRNRSFRRTLMTRRGVALQRRLDPEVITPFRIGFEGTFEGESIDLMPGVEQEFTAVGGLDVKSSVSLTKAALELLAWEWPGDLTFAELAERATAHLLEAGVVITDAPRSRARLATDLLDCFVSGAGVELRTEAPRFARSAGERPLAAPSSRASARRYGFATNARHYRIDLDVLSRAVLPLCDGERDRAAIVEALVHLALEGELTVAVGAAPVHDPEPLRDALHKALEHTLGKLSRLALFEA